MNRTPKGIDAKDVDHIFVFFRFVLNLGCVDIAYMCFECFGFSSKCWILKSSIMCPLESPYIALTGNIFY